MRFLERMVRFGKMSIIRFTLISFLFLWGANVCAQEDLLKDEQEYNRRKKQAYTIYKRIMSYTSRNDLPNRMPNLNTDDTLELKFTSFNTTDFAL